ncbi:hypothetical protein [Winogradskyella haliclonae]|uniref:DUF1579 domain-containing protein n=1 Tax=Winogradskyella haliclonae TaxID=2048558 RepID=A0ABQ2C1C5_9FLAO|nr:hypothetical protein [Winogradskyella haliclonae]GGI58164.1 hypothetical protein GCM10011444_24730 [Winogradskyella haliclonae]
MKKSIFTFFALIFISHLFAQNNKCACCTEKHAEFAFWEGQWDVTLPNGNKAGENDLKLILGKCVLQERWTSASPGYTGTSHSFYNVVAKQWEQVWIDNQGASLHLKGNKKGNQMILQTDEAINKDGNKFVNRVTWTDNDDGTVRQYWEVITQTKEGEKISVAFDGLYRRK